MCAYHELIILLFLEKQVCVENRFEINWAYAARNINWKSTEIVKAAMLEPTLTATSTKIELNKNRRKFELKQWWLDLTHSTRILPSYD